MAGMQYITINNWHKFQHYKDRRPTWIKLLIEIIDEFDPDGKPKKYYSLPDNAKTTFLHLLCLRALYNEKIPYPTNAWLRKRLGLRRITLQPLADAGFIIIDSDTVSKPYQSDTEMVRQSKSKRESKRESKSIRTNFVPPCIKEIAEYVKLKGYNVDVKKFYDYYTESNWHDRDGKSVRNWKQKIIAVWNKPGAPPRCRHSGCKEHPVYTTADDTGQTCWWCENHRPITKPSLPNKLTTNLIKTVPSGDKRSVSDKRNEQLNKLLNEG